MFDHVFERTKGSICNFGKSTMQVIIFKGIEFYTLYRKSFLTAGDQGLNISMHWLAMKKTTTWVQTCNRLIETQHGVLATDELSLSAE